MIDTIYVLGGDGKARRELVRAFQAQAPAGCEVEAIGAAGQLLARLGTGSPCRLVALEASSSEGFELIRALRAQDRSLPIVALSANGNVDLAARAIAAGATDLLVRGERLEERIATLLGKLRGLFEALAKNRDLDAQLANL